MNIIEKQTELGRTLFQINTNTVREYAQMQRENVEKYFELNRSYTEKLPEIRDMGSFMELQREYNETLWNGVRESVKGQTELLKTAMEDTGKAFQEVFQGEEQVEETPAPKAKAKAKAKKTEEAA